MEDISNIINDKEYFETLNKIINDITETQRQVLFNANNQRILMYYRIGQELVKNNKYGANLIKTLATDLKVEFPDLQGFSERNLRYMQKFAKEFEYNSIIENKITDVPWKTLVTIIDKVKKQDERLWYINKTLENYWARSVLEHQIATNLYNRQALPENKITNYKKTLPIEIGKKAIEMFKDPYVFDIEYHEGSVERDVEDALVSNITNLLLEFRKRICFRRKTISFGNRRRRLLYRLIILQFRVKMLCSCRIKNCKICSRICRKVKLLFKCSRYVIKERNR